MDTLFLGLRVVISLAAVLGLLWVIQKKVATRTGRGAKQAKHVTVVARQGIAGKASVAVVDVEGIRYVLGVTETQVSVLGSGAAPADATVTPLAPIAQTVTAVPAAATGAADFAAALEQAKAPEIEDEVVEYAPVFAADHRNRRQAPAAQYRRTGVVTPVPTTRRAARATVVAPAQQSPLAGSILSANTWKQAAAAMRSQRRA